MKNGIKILIGSASLIVVFLIVSVYILTPAKRIGPAIKPVELAAFYIQDIPTQKEATELRKKVMGAKGVTACAVNTESKIASVTYYPDVTSEKEVQLALELNGVYSVSKHVYPVGDKGCPVSGIQAFLDKTFNQ